MLLSSCEKQEDLGYIQYMHEMLEMTDEHTTPYFENNPLPEGKERLRVLAIGNSYTDDGVGYISQILGATTINPDSYCVYKLVVSNTSVQYWADKARSSDVMTLTHVAGNEKAKISSGTFRELLSQDWDVVVMQQLSAVSTNYKTYNPYLRNLIDEVRAHCLNSHVTIAWQMVHCYWTGYPSQNNKPKGDERWLQICNATRCMKIYDGIDVIIPTGTAIQNARHSSLQTTHDITRDGTHLAYGVGRYIAACTWVESLFSPVYGICVLGNTCNHDKESWENDKTVMYDDSVIPVNDSNRYICQLCAYYACLRPYELSYVEELK